MCGTLFDVEFVLCELGFCPQISTEKFVLLPFVFSLFSFIFSCIL